MEELGAALVEALEGGAKAEAFACFLELSAGKRWARSWSTCTGAVLAKSCARYRVEHVPVSDLVLHLISSGMPLHEAICPG